MLNCFCNNEYELLKDDLSLEEKSAIEYGKLLRTKEKTFLARNVQRIINKYGLWILGHHLKDFGQEIIFCEQKFGFKFKGYKVYLLWNALRGKRPQCIVEYGSGSSTILISAILHKNRIDFGVEGCLYSFEQNPVYYQLVGDAFPGRLLGNVKRIHSAVGYERYGEFREIFYKDSPEILPSNVDVVFIDGPAAVPQMENSDSPIFSGDLRRLQLARKWKYAFTDIRYFNAKYFAEVMQDCVVSEKILYRTIEIKRRR